jgi:hypothetical protein
VRTRGVKRFEQICTALALLGMVYKNRDRAHAIDADCSGVWTPRDAARTKALETRLRRSLAGQTELFRAGNAYFVVPGASWRALKAIQSVLETLEAVLTLIAQIVSATGVTALEKPPAPPLEIRPQLQAIAPSR